MQKTIGGDRLGAGKKMQEHLNNYHRSTHDLSQTWTSPMTPGVLYPFLCIPAMRGDKFELKLHGDCITIPTKGPLFGSFKMQYDIFCCPARLYQAFLHNNPTAIGLRMNQIMLPTITQTFDTVYQGMYEGKLNNSCLLKYMGISGIGHRASNQSNVSRKFNAVPILAYYDIFKNYYSNKQEENAYVITSNKEIESILEGFLILQIDQNSEEHEQDFDADPNWQLRNDWSYIQTEYVYRYHPINEDWEDPITPTEEQIQKRGYIKVFNTSRIEITDYISLEEMSKLSQGVHFDWTNQGYVRIYRNSANDNWVVRGQKVQYVDFKLTNATWRGTDIHLHPFTLKNIDDMRMTLLSQHTLGVAYDIMSFNKLPYSCNTFEFNKKPLNGLVVKTYQNDLFNNWINTEWIDGDNGIAEITKINTADDDGFTIDALNLSEKLYNMLNRVALAGNTYEDWQDVVWTDAVKRHVESPIYCGGMSSEVVFEQIVQSAPAEGEPLGTLAGRGRHIQRKGGHIVIKVDEPSFIIGIVSLTPRIKYTQGNEWYMTELKSIDDLHKPALDQIGFQNLIAERIAWWDTFVRPDGTMVRDTIGKVPAWIEYMTAVDKAYGDFAEPDALGFMVLNRNYEQDTEEVAIKDATTYIDPTKYNYAFAYTNLDAQNFWAEIYSHITARRLMSAKQIPSI